MHLKLYESYEFTFSFEVVRVIFTPTWGLNMLIERDPFKIKLKYFFDFSYC